MKFLKSLLIFILIITLLLLGVVGFCALNPHLSETLAGILYGPDSPLVSKEEPLSGNEYTLPGNEEDGYPLSETGDAMGEGDGSGVDYPYMGMYVAPDISTLTVPGELASRTGYEPLLELPKDLTNPEADEIENTLGYGDTGDELSFDALYYPFYHMLNDKEKHLYRQVVANANSLTDRFKPVEECNRSELKRVMEAVFNDHPELFWLDTAYSFSQRNNGDIVEIDLKFNKCADDLDESKARFNEKAEEILNGARGLESDFEKEKYVHDALADRIDYNLSAPMNQSAYSALVNGSTVCAGYARAFQYLMQQLGVPCYYCTGFAGENHAWNIIKLDDDFYNVDVTWDDSEEGNYDWFNKTDSDYRGTHVRKDLSVNLPPCNGTGYQVESKRKDPLSADSFNGDAYADVDNVRPGSDDASAGLVSGENADTLSNNAALRSFADTGLGIEDVLTDMDSYYENCKEHILQNGAGTYEFQNVIVGSDLLNKWQQAYNSGAYKNAYAQDVMNRLGIDNLRMNLTVEALNEDMYLITHYIEGR